MAEAEAVATMVMTILADPSPFAKDNDVLDRHKFAENRLPRSL